MGWSVFIINGDDRRDPGISDLLGFAGIAGDKTISFDLL